MSTLQFNAIATQILLDESFQQALQSGQGQDCLAPFQLTDQERIAILTIRSKSTRQFISELYDVMQHLGLRPSYQTSGNTSRFGSRT